MSTTVGSIRFAEGDLRNPRNWSKPYKWMLTVLISFYTFVSPMSSSMVAPGLTQMSQDLSIRENIVTQMILSIFVLAYGIGPMVVGPLSEHYGRLPVLQLGNFLYLIFNTACGASKTSAQLIVFRALSGFGGSAPLAIGAGAIADLFDPDSRGTAVALYNMAPLLGPSIGTVLGAVITQYLSWRWVFYATSVFDAVLLLVGGVFLRETYGPKILKKIQAGRVHLYDSEELDLEPQAGMQRTPLVNSPHSTVLRSIGRAFARPIRMLATQPAIQLIAVYIALLYGIMYLTLSTFPQIWVGQYHMGVAIGGLNYFSLGLGYLIGSQICIVFVDRIYKRLKERNNEQGQPEMKLPLLVPGASMIPFGLVLYGWSAEYNLPWIVPDLGALLFSLGVIMSMQCATNYLIDSYGMYTASAVGAVTILRGFAGFGFPLFAPYMFQALGLGWGNSLLALVSAVLGYVFVSVLWYSGSRIRQRSRFCADSL